MGRRTLYNPDIFPLLAEKYARRGLNDKEIAKSLGIAKTAYYEYQIKYSEFAEAIKRGKVPVDVVAENSLYKRVTGYTYEERTTEVKVDDKGVTKPSTIRTVTKHVPPDVGAIAFWLKNRNPEEWSDKQKVDLSIKAEQPLFPDVQEDNSNK